MSAATVAAVIAICCGPGLAGCGPDCASVRQADATQWVLVDGGGLALRGTGFTVIYDAGTDTYRVQWTPPEGSKSSAASWYENTLDDVDATIQSRIDRMRATGQRP